MPYSLRCSIKGHSNDVRALALSSNHLIMSGSRDRSVKLWTESDTGYQESRQVTYHSHYVSSLCFVEPSKAFPQGLIFSGGHDHQIFGFSPVDHDKPQIILNGHTGPVCCLTPSNCGKILLSSSWDGTAKMWDLSQKECLKTLIGHSGTVWSIIQMSNGSVLTCSSDKFIMVFSENGEYVKTFSGHTDCVRGLASLSEDIFISCSNDGTVRKWSLSENEVLQTFYCHDSFIYSLSVVGDIIACGCEDNTLLILSCEKGIQEILKLPATSIWSVKILPNSDIVTGSSDGHLRIFTKDTSRMAAEEQIAEYKLEFIKDKKPGNSGPSAEVLNKNGAFDGEIKLINERGTNYCYSWSQDNSRWILIGEECSQTAESHQSSQNSSSDVFYPPQKFLVFANYDLKPIFKKIEEFMTSMDYNKNDINYSLNVCEDVFQGKNTQNALELLYDSLEKWPENFVFPLLDIVRIGVLNSHLQNIIFSEENYGKLRGILERFMKSESLANNKMFLFRIYCNFLSSETGKECVFKESENLLKRLPTLLKEKHKGLEIAASTFILNMSGLCWERKEKDIKTTNFCSEAIREALKTISEPEAVLRLVAAIGTLSRLDISFVQNGEIKEFLERVSSWESEERSKSNAAKCAQNILDEIKGKI